MIAERVNLFVTPPNFARTGKIADRHAEAADSNRGPRTSQDGRGRTSSDRPLGGELGRLGCHPGQDPRASRMALPSLRRPAPVGRSPRYKAFTGGSDFDLDRLVALCRWCHEQTDAPYERGRLVVTPQGDGQFSFEIVRRERRLPAWAKSF